MYLTIRSYFVNFFISSLPSLLVLTIFNYIYFIDSVVLFAIRETFMFLVLGLLFHFQAEFSILKKENDYINTVLLRDFPFLRLRLPMVFLCLVLVFYSTCNASQQENTEWYHHLFIFAGLLGFFSIVLTVFRVFAILSNPILFEFFNIKKSIKYHGANSFSTTSKIVNMCKLCGPGVLVVGVVGDVIGTIIMYGDVDARCHLTNMASRHFSEHYTQARTNRILKLGDNLLDFDPNLRSQIVDEHGRYKLGPIVHIYNSNVAIHRPKEFFSLEVNHKVDKETIDKTVTALWFLSPSKFFGWSKKG